MGEVAFIAIKLVDTSCCACGMVFSVPETWLEQRRANGESFFCPNGHSLSYKETTVKKLEKQLENEKQRREWAEKNEAAAREQEQTARRAEAIVRGKLKAQSERVKNGVCPCCNRTFQDLQRHMNTKHPDWTKT